MTTSIVMPKMGYDMTEGKIARWLKREGESVRGGEAIAEIETDKVTIEMEADADGVLSSILVPEGLMTPVGQPIAILSTPGEASAVGQPPDNHDIDSPPAPPSLSTPVDRPAQMSITPARSTPEESPSSRLKSAGTHEVNASPLARRLAKEQGVDLSTVRGSGPGGRITREDVLAAADAGGGAPDVSLEAAPIGAASLSSGETDKKAEVIQIQDNAPRSVTNDGGATRASHDDSAAAERSAPSSAAAGSPTEQALTRLQRTMARRMAESKREAPHFYLTREVDMTAALVLRAEINAAGGDEDGGKISVNDLVVKAAAMALIHFPTLNASFAGDRLVLHDEIAIAIAVALEDGLVTPVLHHAAHTSIALIARTTRDLAARARGGTSRAADYDGATFTVSNLGMFGVDAFTAIINPPQAAILAVGAVRRVPVYVEDALVPRDRLSLTLSADHRVADGALGARFLAATCDLLEHPLRLLLS